MYNIYMDSGTSTTRAYLINGLECADSELENVGTKDSAISGGNGVLISGMKSCCDRLLMRNGLTMDSIDGIWASGMVTNTFGIVEVEHVSTPVNARKLLETVYRHQENTCFNREVALIRGMKTAQPGQLVSLDNIAEMNNVRGEEIESVGLTAAGILPSDMDCALISPGSHSHSIYMRGGSAVDILSTFTGEAYHAISVETILKGELEHGPVKMEAEHVLHGYRNLERYGFSRALYIIHATKVFGIADDAIRAQMLQGVIAGSTVGALSKKIADEWRGVQKIVIIGGKPYMEAYKILCRHLLPDTQVVLYDGRGQTSLALRGFLELLRLHLEGAGERKEGIS